MSGEVDRVHVGDRYDGGPTAASLALPLTDTAVAVVGMSYAPEPTGIAPYTTGLAEALYGHGASVDVLAGVPHYPTWRVGPEDRWRLRRREVLNGVRVQRARHFVPSRQAVLSRLAWEATFLANASLMQPRRVPDVVVGVTPSLSGAVVAARLAARHHVPLVLVVQDLMGQAALQSGIRGGSAVARSAAHLEGRALRRADRVAIVSSTFSRQMRAYGVPGDRVTLLPNWSHISPATRSRAQVRQELGWSDDCFVVLHTGNMGLKQGLGTVLEAARLLGDRRDLRIVLLGDGNQRRSLEGAAADIDALDFLDPVAGDAYADVLQAADLLLVNELPSVGEMSLPSKLTSYFTAGQPVLAAVSEDGACAQEIARTGGAALRVEPGRPALLLEAVERLRLDPQRLQAMGAAGAAYAQRALGRDRASRAALDLVLDLLPGRVVVPQVHIPVQAAAPEPGVPGAHVPLQGAVGTSDAHVPEDATIDLTEPLHASSSGEGRHVIDLVALERRTAGDVSAGT